MNILITGGLGNLGSWITEHLVEKGFNVKTFSSRDRNVLPDSDFERIFGDIENPRDLNDLFSRHSFDKIIHLASVNESAIPDYAEKALGINALGTRKLLQSIVDSGKTGAHFIYFSTIHVYGKNSGELIENETFPEPANDYANTHLFAEYYVKQFHTNYKIPFTIFRLTNGYGLPKDKESSKWYLVLNDLVKSAFDNKKIVLNSNGTPSRDFIWLGDVCRIVEKCVNDDVSNEVFNLGSGNNFSILQLAEIVGEVYRERYGEKVEISVNENDENIYKIQNVSIEKLKKKFGYFPQDKISYEAGKIFDFLEQTNRRL